MKKSTLQITLIFIAFLEGKNVVCMKSDFSFFLPVKIEHLLQMFRFSRIFLLFVATFPLHLSFLIQSISFIRSTIEVGENSENSLNALSLSINVKSLMEKASEKMQSQWIY